jgi:E3 ubiquitin-protein ligase HERC3
MGSEVTQIACGRCHVVVYLASSNRLYSFGLGGSGQLGIGLANLNKTGPTIIKSENNGSNTMTNNHIYALFAGGDQSFLITTSKQDQITALDYRTSLIKTHNILNADIIENFELKPITQPIVKETGLVTMVAILNPGQL